MSKVYLLMARFENEESDESYICESEVLKCFADRQECLKAIDDLTIDDYKDNKIFQHVITDVDYSYLDEKYTKDNHINPDCVMADDVYPRRGSRICRLAFNFFNKWERVEQLETIGYAEFWCREMDIIEPELKFTSMTDYLPDEIDKETAPQ